MAHFHIARMALLTAALCAGISTSVEVRPRAADAAQHTPHVRVAGTVWHRQDGRTFAWRGISAFRLVEMVAHGRERDADAYLKWAAERDLTVVRVLAMARHLFRLDPGEGRAALPKLLDLAARRGLVVEVVALADTASYAGLDLSDHVTQVGAICARAPNAVLELANEPTHATQSLAVHDAARLLQWRALVPREVPVSLGSVERGDGFAQGDYVTWHAPRSAGASGWENVTGLARGAELIARFKKPVVSDEPIGAADRPSRNRRDNRPERFRAAALLTRLAGMGATFHYEGGLQAALPSPAEERCLDGWREGLAAVPPGVGTAGAFSGPVTSGAAVVVRGGRVAGLFERRHADRVWNLAVGMSSGATIQPASGWRQVRADTWPGVALLELVRSGASVR